MGIGPRVTTIGKITTADIVGEVKSWNYEPDRARPIVRDVARRAADAIGAGLVAHDGLAELVVRNAERLLAE